MKNFFIAVILAVIEGLILYFVDDHTIRYYVGDIIIVLFLYFLCRSFVNENMLLPIGVLIIAIAIETGKMYGIGEIIINKIGSDNAQVNGFIRTMTEVSFDMEDIICYIVGVVFIYLGIAVKKMLGRE